MGIDWKREWGSNLKVWIHAFIQQISFESLLHSTSCSRCWKKTNITLSWTLSYNEESPLLVGSFLPLPSEDPLATSPERKILQEERNIMQVSPFSPDCTRLDHALWMNYQVKPGSRRPTCKDLMTLKLF